MGSFAYAEPPPFAEKGRYSHLFEVSEPRPPWQPSSAAAGIFSSARRCFGRMLWVPEPSLPFGTSTAADFAPDFWFERELRRAEAAELLRRACLLILGFIIAVISFFTPL
jgi:hypothetical protein